MFQSPVISDWIFTVECALLGCANPDSSGMPAFRSTAYVYPLLVIPQSYELSCGMGLSHLSFSLYRHCFESRKYLEAHLVVNNNDYLL